LGAAGDEDIVRRGVETVLPQIVREPVPQRRIARATFRTQRLGAIAVEDIGQRTAKLGHGNESRITRTPGETNRIWRQRAAQNVAESLLPFHVDRMHEVALPGRQGGRRRGGCGFTAAATRPGWCPRRQDVGAGSAARLDGPRRLELGVRGDDGDAADPQIAGELSRRRKSRTGGERAIRDLALQTLGDLLIERPGATRVQG
jgi:hypothetical protein